MDAEEYRKLAERADYLIARRRERKATHDQVMNELWAYADGLEVESVLRRLGLAWRDA